MVSKEELKIFGNLGIISPLLLAIGIAIGYASSNIYSNFQKDIINQNRPYRAQIKELNGDSIPDLLVYSKGGESILIGQENGEFLSIDDVFKAKKDSLEKQLKDLTK